MKNIFRYFWALVLMTVISFSLIACNDDESRDEDYHTTGTIQIRVNNIPEFLMASGFAGHNIVGLYPANQASLTATPLAGRDTAVFGDDRVGGSGNNQWWSFYMYNDYNGQKHIGPAGNYDIGFIIRGGAHQGYAAVLRNVRLEVNRLNTFSFNDAVDPDF